MPSLADPLGKPPTVARLRPGDSDVDVMRVPPASERLCYEIKRERALQLDDGNALAHDADDIGDHEPTTTSWYKS